MGTFGFNFAIFIATMSTVEFGRGAAEYGILSSVMAIGSVAGALLAARREKPRMRIVVVAAAGFGVACTAAAFTPKIGRGSWRERVEISVGAVSLKKKLTHSVNEQDV